MEIEDIIDLPHWNPKNHRRMPLANRAAQFAPFAALVGHDEAIKETARLTDPLETPDSEEASRLNRQIAYLIDHVNNLPEIQVTYFVPDKKKTGGAYVNYRGTLRKVSEAEQLLIFTDGTRIAMPMCRNITIQPDPE